MKYTTTTQFVLTCIVTASTLLIPKLAQAQLPPIVDGPQTGNAQKDAPSNSLTTTPAAAPPEAPAPAASAPEAPAPAPVTTAAASTIKVNCQDLRTVVKKGDREATMVNWNYDGFGKEFTPAKRCQIVSERLQQAADNNGGSFKDLQIASGTLNAMPVVCALQSKDRKCNQQNLLFTLKPENSHNPDAVIQKIFSFAKDGSSSLNESASRTPQADMSLGNWEQKAFPQSSKSTPKTSSSPTKSKHSDPGF
jgi:Circadian oscillating protein COP23